MAEIHKWHGFKELEQNLKLLGTEMHEKGVKRMMSRAAVLMRDDAKRRAPILAEPDSRRKPGTVRDAIKIWRKRDTPFAASYFVGVRGLSKMAIKKFKVARAKAGQRWSGSFNQNDPYYWRFLEFGTSKMRAQPFLRPAFESQKMASVKVALDEGRAFVQRTVRRFKKTQKR